MVDCAMYVIILCRGSLSLDLSAHSHIRLKPLHTHKITLTLHTREKVRIGGVLGRVLSAVRHHRVKLDSNFVSVVVSISLLEGIGRQLDPEIDIFKEALGVIVW